MKHDCQCDKCYAVLFGSKPDGSEGLAWICTRTADAVFGTKEDPDSGLVRRMREFEVIKWKIVGACAVITPLGGFAGAWLLKVLTE